MKIAVGTLFEWGDCVYRAVAELDAESYRITGHMLKIFTFNHDADPDEKQAVLAALGITITQETIDEETADNADADDEPEF